MHARRRRRSAKPLDVTPLNAPARAGPVQALSRNPRLPRKPPGGGRRARRFANSRPRVCGVIRVSREDGRGRCGERSCRGRRWRRNKALILGDDPADAGADGQHIALGGGDEFQYAEAGASTSIPAFRSRSRTASRPFRACAPSAACQRPIRPDVMSMLTRGMTISTATGHTSPCARRRAAATMSSTCGTAAFRRTGL